MLDDADLLLLDSETTDLHGFLVEIAITDREGAPVFHSLVNPLEEIDPQAQAVHGITPDELAGAPTFAQIEPQLREIVWGKTVVIYNAAFDIGILCNELRREIAEQMVRAHVPDIAPQPADVERDSLLGMAYSEAYCQGIARSVADTWLGRVHEQCAMEKWAIYIGERSPYHDNYRWQPLDGGHRALDDCRACLALLHRMATRVPASPMWRGWAKSKKMRCSANLTALRPNCGTSSGANVGSEGNGQHSPSPDTKMRCR